MAEIEAAAGERRILVSESAARRIAALKDQEEAPNAHLRIAVSGGGCSGFQYGLSFDDQRNPDDYTGDQPQGPGPDDEDRVQPGERPGTRRPGRRRYFR